jgi:hypothetical protein
MSRMVIAEEAHVVNILPAQSISGATNSDVFSMKDASHATIIVTAGSTNADAGNITIEECDNFTPSNYTAIYFNYAAETTAAGDTLGALTNANSIDVSANDNIMYVIEIDAENLTEGYNNLRLCWSAPGGATVVSAVAILTGLSYAGDQNRTQIA